MQTLRHFAERLFQRDFWDVGIVHAVWLSFFWLLFGVLAIADYKALSTIDQKSPVAARVDRVWSVQGRGGGTFAFISYVKVTPSDERIDCYTRVRLGQVYLPVSLG